MSFHKALLALRLEIAFVMLLGAEFHTARAESPPEPLTNSIGMKLVLVPAGSFEMGSSDADAAANVDERPQHPVRLTQPFRIGMFEVTQQEYQAITGTNPSWLSPHGPGRSEAEGQDTRRCPVDMVTWHEAAEFCRKLSERTAEKEAGRVYRLPTEAEWEYACRAGTKTPFSTGDSLATSQACFKPQNGGTAPARAGKPLPVGSFAPNPLGIYDMHGNVWEWCADWYSPDAYRHAVSIDPPGPESGTGHVVRGGAWNFDATYCRSANRDFTRATRRDLGNGFRVVCNP